MEVQLKTSVLTENKMFLILVERVVKGMDDFPQGH